MTGAVICSFRRGLSIFSTSLLPACEQIVRMPVISNRCNLCELLGLKISTHEFQNVNKYTCEPSSVKSIESIKGKKAATDKYSYQNHLKPCIQATP
jgi:hypothetical protein